MAHARKTKSGKWELTLRHPLLPGGRKYFTFDTEEEANSYAQQWRLMKAAGISPPPELLAPLEKRSLSVGYAVRKWAGSGQAAPTQQSPLGSLISEVGDVKLSDMSYTWLTGYIRDLKVKNNLSPGTIRHRIQALSRSIDEYLRHNPDSNVMNPCKLLPKGYSTYSEQDAQLAIAAGKAPKISVVRDRRLCDGEEQKIIDVLSGRLPENRERNLELKGGEALMTLFVLIVNTGLRLKEAYTLTRGQIDLESKIIRAQCSKQWRGRVSFRDVPMVPAVYRALEKHLLNNPMLSGAYLFPFIEEDGARDLKIVSQRLSSRFLKVFDYAGCEGLHEHDLRHEATCRWLEMRDRTGNWLFRLEEVNKIMGWAPGSSMAQRYASFRGTDMANKIWAMHNEEAAAPDGGEASPQAA